VIPVETPTPNLAGFTYFARMRGLPEIKIGQSWSPKHRLIHIRRNGISKQAYPLCVIKGGGWERRFHAAFEPYHIGNEWFEPHAVILETIIAIHAGEFDWSSLPHYGWCVTKPFQTKASLAHWGPLRDQQVAA
jgi:hypothetical protein